MAVFYSRRYIRRYVGSLFVSFILFYTLWKSHHVGEIEMDFIETTTPPLGRKTILLWNSMMYNLQQWHMPGRFDTSQPFQIQNCEITNCIITRNRSKLEQADAVLFYLKNDLESGGQIRPKQVRPDQVFIVSMMSPSNYIKGKSECLENVISMA